jgi:undecaprenyl diphosphate synthase
MTTAPNPPPIIPDAELPPPDRRPRHIGIIMDGNGRWARRQRNVRVFGHRAGMESVRVAVRECSRLGIQRLTLYAFSTENWKRPKLEINYLMGLLERFLKRERPELNQNNVRLTAIGRIAELRPSVRRVLDESMRFLEKNTGMILSLALNYGGREEIVDGIKRYAADVVAGKVDAGALTSESFRQYLYDPTAMDPDLVIRTAGEVRTSNFLLWEAAYAEYVANDACWPEFREAHLHAALVDFARRERKFGALGKDPAKA